MLVVKNPPANAGDLKDAGSIPESGRSPGEGHGNPLQYSFLENPMERGTWQATVHTVTELDMTEVLLISWLQSPSAVILEPKKIKSVTVSIFFHLFAMK